MLKFDNLNRFLIISNKKDYWPGKNKFEKLNRQPLLVWYDDYHRSDLCLKKENSTYEKFEINMFTTCLIQDLQLFRDELFKDCLVIGKFSFVQLDEIKKWRVELCSKPIPRVDITYNNNEIQAIKSYISPKEYRDKVCLKYMF